MVEIGFSGSSRLDAQLVRRASDHLSQQYPDSGMCGSVRPTICFEAEPGRTRVFLLAEETGKIRPPMAMGDAKPKNERVGPWQLWPRSRSGVEFGHDVNA